MKHRRSTIAVVLMILAVVGLRVQAAINIPLTIQEAIYPGSTAGVPRTADPVSVGIPLPDDSATGATDVSQLTLSGASAGQFRVLGRWPSGRIKWVLVDTLASLSAGGKATGIALTIGGSGNFGGSNLATDNGATISVATGTATFTIRKANFNGFHQVVVGGTTIVAAGASTGLIVMGPAPGGTTCGPCATPYSSVNDASSTAVIEENGPVRTVIKATGTHKDASGNPYMNFTVRMHFYKNRSHVKAVTTLRNADHGTSNSFATAFKGHQGYEWRLAPNLPGTNTYEIAKDSGVQNGTIGGTDDVYLYQGESQSLKSEDWCGFGCVPYTKDTGYIINRTGSGNIATGTNTQYPQGWADIRNGSGAGVSIGVYQLAAYWPKSLEFNDGGSDVRIGIWPRQNSQPYYQAWPQWSTHDLYFNFHDAALASPANEFLKVQHALLGRAPRDHYNTARVFPFPVVDPAVEDAFYINTGATANPSNSFVSSERMCCLQDVGTTSSSLHTYRYKSWHQGGGANQTEFRWSSLLNFLTRGFTGRYLDSAHFYRFQTDDVFPHSDGFNWRDKPSDVDLFGRPKLASANASSAFTSWLDQEHGHWYGMTDYYFMSGDEGAKEQLLDGVGDWFLANTTYQAGVGGGLFNTRAVGVQLMGAARYSGFLSAVGNSAGAAAVLTNSTALFDLQVKGVLCTWSEAASQGCSSGPQSASSWTNQGTSRTRGLHWGQDGTVQNWCGSPTAWRFHSTWVNAILQQGIVEFREAKGSGWSDYLTSLDLAYGMSRGSLQEGYLTAGNNRWDQDGFVAGFPLDNPADCPSSPGTGDSSYFVAQPLQTMAMHFYTQYLLEGTTSWAGMFKVNLLKDGAALGMNTSDFGSFGPGAVIAVLDKPTSARLNAVPITGVVNTGGGNYSVSWTVPTGAQSYRIKWGAKQIVDWIGFNPRTNTFTGDPNGTMPWFAATNLPTLPVPAAAGTIQTVTISTGRTGLTAANFSVKAYVGGSGTPPPPPPLTGGSLSLASGNNQTGTAGTALTTPLAAKVSDSSGNPVAGATVTFAVTGGGGAITTSGMATNSAGLAWTSLTLGLAGGTNTVIAASGTLAGSPVTFTATASPTGNEPPAISANQWVNVTPTYQGAPDGGSLVPMTYNNMGVYDPASKRTISFERWYDPVRSMSIYANALVAYDPATNTASVLKLGNWLAGATPLPANSGDPTPIDRHPLGALALDPSSGSVYLVNGANQNGRQYYPDHPNDTWKFSLASRSWSLVATTASAHPPSDTSSYSGMVYDPPSDKLAYFVTEYPNGTKTWLFDPRNNQWSALAADPTSANVYISTAGIAYDSMRNRVLAFGGGFNAVTSGSPKLWAYSVSQNKWTALRDAPIGGTGSEFAYDSVHDVFLALVGQTTLIYDPRTDTWTHTAATIDRGANLTRQNVTYNPNQDVFVFQGGTSDRPVWSLFRYNDGGLTVPGAPTNVVIIR